MEATEIRKRITENHLLGAIRYRGSINYYLNPIAYWIMDQKSYDPNFQPEDYPDLVFRNHIYVVDSNNAEKLISCFDDDKIEANQVEECIRLGADYNVRLLFLIDFDNKIFVSNFYDLEIETYVPSDWIGKFDDPKKFIYEK